MSPELFNQSKNLFLVFPPGCGGNHLANMLSMHPEFEPRYTDDQYYKSMEYKYKNYFSIGPQDDIGCTAHFCDLENLQREELLKFQSKILNSKKRYIFCSHAVEYIRMDYEKEIEQFTDRIICLFTKPSGSNKLVDDRMRKGTWYNGERTDEEVFRDISVKKLYEPIRFSNYSKTKKDNIFTLDTDIFYSLEGYDYLVDVLKTNLGIELPEICRKLHTQYIEYEMELFATVDN
jgi:hypothetical protein